MKDLKEMSISDVIKLRLFRRILRQTIANIYADRIVLRLKAKGVFNVAKIAELYPQVLDKKLKGFSACERSYITIIGNDAFVKTIKRLQENEAKRDSSNGQD